MMDNKILLFAGENYYPSGGWDDYRGSFDTIEDAKKWLQENISGSDLWAHIVKDNKIIGLSFKSDKWEMINGKFNYIQKEWRWAVME